MEATLIKLMETPIPNWLTIVLAVAGILSCFLGYRLLKFFMACIGFIVGLGLGYNLSIEYVSNVGVALLIGFVLGVIIALVIFKIYKLGVFLMAFTATFGFFGQIIGRYNEPGWVWLVATLVVAFIVAIIAMKFVKPVIIIATALNGATLTMMGAFKLTNMDAELMMIVGIILLALLGMIVQFFTTKQINHE